MGKYFYIANKTFLVWLVSCLIGFSSGCRSPFYFVVLCVSLIHELKGAYYQ